jgi:hypothetical protein
MKGVILCLLFLVAACDGDEPCSGDAATPAADAAQRFDAAPAADAAPPDAVPCGALDETCCRIGDSCEPGLGCVAATPGNGTGQCVALGDGAP